QQTITDHRIDDTLHTLPRLPQRACNFRHGLRLLSAPQRAQHAPASTRQADTRGGFFTAILHQTADAAYAQCDIGKYFAFRLRHDKTNPSEKLAHLSSLQMLRRNDSGSAQAASSPTSQTRSQLRPIRAQTIVF